MIAFRSYWVASLLTMIAFPIAEKNGWAERTIALLIPLALFLGLGCAGEFAIFTFRSGTRLYWLPSLALAVFNFLVAGWLLWKVRGVFTGTDPMDSAVPILIGIAVYFLIVGSFVIGGF